MATCDAVTARDVTKYVWFKNISLKDVTRRLHGLEISFERQPQTFYSLKINGPESAIDEFSKETFRRAQNIPLSIDNTNDLVVRPYPPTQPNNKMKLMLTSYFPFVDTKENEGGDKVGSDISTKIQEVIATIRSNLSAMGRNPIDIELIVKEGFPSATWTCQSSVMGTYSVTKLLDNLLEVEFLNLQLNAVNTANVIQQTLEALTHCWDKVNVIDITHTKETKSQ